MAAQRPSIFARLTSVRNASLPSPTLRECCHGGLATAYRMEPRLRVTLGSCGLALALGDVLFAAIFGASAVPTIEAIRRSPGFLESPPVPDWRKGPGAIRAMPTTIALPPLPKAMSKGECPLRLRLNSGAAHH